MPEWIEGFVYGFAGGCSGAFLVGQRARMRGHWLRRGREPRIQCPDAPGHTCVSLDCWQKGCEAERRRAWSQGPGKESAW